MITEIYATNIQNMTQCHSHCATLSDNQKANCQKRSKINHLLLCDYQIINYLEMINWRCKRQLKKIKKAIASGVGVDVKISRTHIRHVVRKRGSLFSTLRSLCAKVLPMATKLAWKVLPGFANGALVILEWIRFLGLRRLEWGNKPERWFPYSSE